jgi:hypothetical protein
MEIIGWLKSEMRNIAGAQEPLNERRLKEVHKFASELLCAANQQTKGQRHDRGARAGRSLATCKDSPGLKSLCLKAARTRRGTDQRGPR